MWNIFISQLIMVKIIINSRWVPSTLISQSAQLILKVIHVYVTNVIYVVWAHNERLIIQGWWSWSSNLPANLRKCQGFVSWFKVDQPDLWQIPLAWSLISIHDLLINTYYYSIIFQIGGKHFISEKILQHCNGKYY